MTMTMESLQRYERKGLTMRRIIRNSIIAITVVPVIMLTIITQRKDDFAAEYSEGNTVLFNGDLYHSIPTTLDNRYGLAETIGRLDKGGIFMSIKYDPALNYIYARRQLYSKTCFAITPGNEITAVYLGYSAQYRLPKQGDIDLFLSLESLDGKPYSYNSLSSGRFSEPISTAYDNCPVSASVIGTIARSGDTWIYVPKDSTVKIQNNDGTDTFICNGIIIDDGDITQELMRIATENDIRSLLHGDPDQPIPTR